MKIAVTGAGGQLGSELCRQLGDAAIGLCRPQFDLTSADSVRQTLLGLRPDAVINAAAYTRVDRAEEEAELCWSVNATGVGLVVDACRELGCPLVQISTDYVFGRDAARRTPYREEDEPGPVSVYAESKLAGELRAAEYERHTIVRTCGLYGQLGGPSGPGNFVATMLRLGRQGKPLRVVDDQHCTPSYTRHVARAVLYLLERQAFGIYHVVNRGSTTWYDFAAVIFRLAGIEVAMERITTDQYGAPAARPAYSVLDTSKYHALGGPIMPTWQEALTAYLSTTAEPGR